MVSDEVVDVRHLRLPFIIFTVQKLNIIIWFYK